MGRHHRDYDQLEEVTVDQQQKQFVLRTDAPGRAGTVFKAVGVALPAARPPPAGGNPTARPDPPPKNAADGHGVVPRAIDFSELTFQIRNFAIRGV